MSPWELDPATGGTGSSWVSEEDADTYFATRLGADEYWIEGAPKTAALITAQRYIELSGLFVFTDAQQADPSQAMMDAVCEQATFLLRDVLGIEMRSALIAQGVASAGIIEESFNRIIAHRTPNKIVIAPLAESLLVEYLKPAEAPTQITSSFDVVR